MSEFSNIECVRFLSLLETVWREGLWLLRTETRLFHTPIDAAWIERLQENDDHAERLDAFTARFGRMQDTLGDKLIPQLLKLVAERPGSSIDNINRMEKLGILSSVNDWLEARNLRNKLVHEYMSNAEEFALALNRVHTLLPLLINTYNAINRYARDRIESADKWPGYLPVPVINP